MTKLIKIMQSQSVVSMQKSEIPGDQQLTKCITIIMFTKNLIGTLVCRIRNTTITLRCNMVCQSWPISLENLSEVCHNELPLFHLCRSYYMKRSIQGYMFNCLKRQDLHCTIATSHWVLQKADKCDLLQWRWYTMQPHLSSKASR